VAEYTPAPGETTYGTALSGCLAEPVDVGRATPTVVTDDTPKSAAVGSTITDTATVTGLSGGPSPAGTVTFHLFSNNSCTGAPVLSSSPVALTAGTAPVASASGSLTAPGPAGSFWWVAEYTPAPGETTYGTALSGCLAEPVDIGRATPTVVTDDTPKSAAVGDTIADTATVSGVSGGPSPAGTVTFHLFSNNSCTGAPVLSSSPVGLTPGTAPVATASGSLTAPGPAGDLWWVAEYTPAVDETTYGAAISVCAAEPVTITAPVVSLSVTKTSGPNPYTAGQPLTYTIVVRNGGPDTAAPATVVDPLAPELRAAGFTWTCTAAPGNSCGAASGGSPLHDTPTIPAGGSVTYTLTGTVPAGTTTVLTNTVTVTPPPDAEDPGCTPSCEDTNHNPTTSEPGQPIEVPGTGTGPLPLAVLLLAGFGGGVWLAWFGVRRTRRRG
jgi:uncharacterized repeat protein (TIGR01451 family)